MFRVARGESVACGKEGFAFEVQSSCSAIPLSVRTFSALEPGLEHWAMVERGSLSTFSRIKAWAGAGGAARRASWSALSAHRSPGWEHSATVNGARTTSTTLPVEFAPERSTRPPSSRDQGSEKRQGIDSPMRRKSTAPRMLRRHGTYTPFMVPSSFLIGPASSELPRLVPFSRSSITPRRGIVLSFPLFSTIVGWWRERSLATCSCR